MKTFQIPDFYTSPLISTIKQKRKEADKLKKDYTPSCLDFGTVQIYLARHFGFCYGVENAIEIAFKTVFENPTKRIYLLSEMIHNPQVNADLIAHGVHFIMDTVGKQLVPWEVISSDDIVIIPAFGTTIETENVLKEKGINPLQYNTTCPFVERVWKKGAQIAKEKYSIIVHGKPNHEETRATFSHSSQDTPSLVIENMKDAKRLAMYIKKILPAEQFYTEFVGKYSANFRVETDLERIGVINQTTMLAEDTQAIADYLKTCMQEKYGLTAENTALHFADTRDTLCYATNDNQTAVAGLLQQPAHLAIVVGGYNSSNTSHLVELCEEKLPTYFIKDHHNILSEKEIIHFNLHTHTEEITPNFLPKNTPAKIILTSGASCPDAIVEKVISKILSFFENVKTKEEVLSTF